MVSYGLVLCCAPACTAYYGIRVSIMSSDVLISSDSLGWSPNPWISGHPMGWSCWRYPIISSFGPCQEILCTLSTSVSLHAPILLSAGLRAGRRSWCRPHDTRDPWYDVPRDPGIHGFRGLHPDITCFSTLGCSQTPRIRINSLERGLKRGPKRVTSWNTPLLAPSDALKPLESGSTP